MGRKSPGSLSLARSRRLRRAADIQALSQRGNRDEWRSFVVLWHRRGGGRKAAFTVSRRVGGAVERNRARRRIREAYRRYQHMQPGGVEVVFVGRPAALSLPFAQLLGEMRQALEGLAVARPG